MALHSFWMTPKDCNEKRYTYLSRCKWWHWQRNWLPEVNVIDRQCCRLEELSDISKVQGRSFPHSPEYLPSPGLQPGLTLEFEESRIWFDRWTPRRHPTKKTGQVWYKSGFLLSYISAIALKCDVKMRAVKNLLESVTHRWGRVKCQNLSKHRVIANVY